MSRPYAEPPGTPLGPRLAPEVTPTPWFIEGTCTPNVRPTSMVVSDVRPRSGVGDTYCEVWLGVGRSVVLSFGFGVGLVESRTSEFGSGVGASVDTTSLLGLLSSSPVDETARGGVNPSNLPSTVETSIALSPPPCPSPAAMMSTVSGLRKYQTHTPSSAAGIRAGKHRFDTEPGFSSFSSQLA